MHKEQWVPINRLNGLYEVSSSCRIRSLPRKWCTGRIMKQSASIRGYLTVRITEDGKSRGMYVHLFFARAFLSNPLNKPFINHKNGIKTDNRLENLEWVTKSENNTHAYRSGLKKANRKLTMDQALEIRHKYKNLGISQSNLGKEYKITQSQVGRIVRNITYLD